MAFARVDHLGADEFSITDFVVPRPHSSVLYRVKDNRLGSSGIRKGDLIVVERDQPLRGGRIALVSVGGEARLVRMDRDGPGVTFDAVPGENKPVEVLGIASCVIRPLLP